MRFNSNPRITLLALSLLGTLSANTQAQDTNKIRMSINGSSSVKLQSNGVGLAGKSVAYLLSGKLLQVRVADPVLCADFADSPQEPLSNVKLMLRDPNDATQNSSGFRGLAPLSGGETGGVRLKFAPVTGATEDQNKYLLRIATKNTLQCYVFPGGVVGAQQPSSVATTVDKNGTPSKENERGGGDLIFTDGFEDSTACNGAAGVDLSTNFVQTSSAATLNQTFGYTFEVTNSGSTAASGVQVRDFYPANVLQPSDGANTVVSCSASVGSTCGTQDNSNNGQSYVTHSGATVAGCGKLTFTVRRSARGNAIVGSQFRLQAAAFSQPGIEGNRANNPSVSNLIGVTNNLAPTLTWVDSPNQTIPEDTTSGQVRFTVNDPDGTVSAGNITVTASSGNTNVIDVAGISLTGQGTADRTVQLTPKANAFGFALITLNLNDGLTTTPVSFSLTVTGVNDAPSFSAPTDISWPVGTAGLRTISNLVQGLDYGPGESGQTLQSVQVRVISGGGIFSSGSAPDTSNVNIFSNNASVAYGLNGTSGTATIGLRAVDNGGGSCASAADACNTSTERTFFITVVGPNTPPTITWNAQCVNTASGSPVTATVTPASGPTPTIVTIAAFTGTSNRRLSCTLATVSPGTEPLQTISIPAGGVTVNRTGSDVTLDAPEDVLSFDAGGSGDRILRFNSLIARTATGTENYSFNVLDSGDTVNGGQNQATFQLRIVK
jgi:uncharacterized repeat protein (TIGR01451 family)